MAATAVLIPRAPAAVRITRCSTLPLLPPRVSAATFSSPVKLIPESRRFPLLQNKATEETSVDAGELFSDLKWDKVENKSTVIIYGGGAIVVWLSSILVVPLTQSLCSKDNGIGGTGIYNMIVYRYLLFKNCHMWTLKLFATSYFFSQEKELATDIEGIEKRIAGAE
ncbi:Nucleic acid-binding, OB-fold-like protein [Hibiscus syriacus]|uniref:Nucleic acid-binding, OB-fold-like protein n=1 Tax=Hibiscus syriacus TaxID=106335 RepID=A0A6A3CH81_HIBSY|nr:Nucleic acid-binding, OB-fold-like protein [Hibiscus syriacus]